MCPDNRYIQTSRRHAHTDTSGRTHVLPPSAPNTRTQTSTRPCAPCGSPYAGSANPHEGVGAGVWPRGVKRAASSPSPSISSHDADVPSATPITSLLAPMNVHAPAFYPPDDSEL